MPVSGLVLPPLMFLLQLPGRGEVPVQAPPREVRMVYWELVPMTEVSVRLVPTHPDGKPPLLHPVFQAFFPGRAPREPYALRPQWPKDAPARLVARAEAFPLTVFRDLSLGFVLDGYTFDLTGPGNRYTFLSYGDDCAPTAVEAEVPPSLLRALTVARTVRGHALGFPIQLVEADQRALAEFAARVGLSGKAAPDR